MFARLSTVPGVLAALAAALVFGVDSAAAQRLSLSPTIGVYIPTSELVKAAEGEEFKQEVALSVGGRLGVTLSPRFGIETSVSYVPSNLRFTFDQTETTTDANHGTRVEDADLGDVSRTQNDVQIAFGLGFPVGR
jgi:hypothetical protein